MTACVVCGLFRAAKGGRCELCQSKALVMYRRLGATARLAYLRKPRATRWRSAVEIDRRERRA